MLATLCWAGNFVAGVPLVEVLPPFALNAARWLVACAVLVPLLLWREGLGFVRPALARWPALLVMGVTGVLLFNALVYWALTSTTSINASLIGGAVPIVTLFVAAAMGAGFPTGRRLLGSLVCLVGVAWLVSRGSVEALLNLSFNRGDLLMLVAAVCWALYTVIGGRVFRTISPLAATTASALLVLPLLIFAGGFELLVQQTPAGSAPAITLSVVLGVLYLGVFASVVAFLAWNAGVGRLGPSRSAIFLNLVPLFTAAIAVPVLGEGVILAQVLGGLLVLAGVTIVSWPSRESPKKPGDLPE